MLSRLLQTVSGVGTASRVPSSFPVNPFPEEQLSLSGEQRCGFFPARLGLLLKDGRYELLRKLGRGRYSSTWLVLDSQYV
jgi:serine/threonine-protein kinase SRPK3